MNPMTEDQTREGFGPPIVLNVPAWHPLPCQPGEMSFVQSRDLITDFIMRAFALPPHVFEGDAG